MKPIDDVTFWRDPEIAGVELCLVRGSRHIFPEHAHAQRYTVGLMERGGSYCLGTRNADSLVVRGQIALINPGQVHSGVPHRGRRVSYRMYYFSCAQMDAVMAEISRHGQSRPVFPRMVVDEPVLGQRLRLLSRVIDGPCGRLAKQTAVMDALVQLITCCGNTTVKQQFRPCGRPAITRAMDYLAADLDRKVSLDAAARTAGLSRYHFLRVFKQETGLSPHLYRTMRRIDRAKGLLRNGMAFSETALAVGFSDQSHFTNTFRKFTGATPRQYLA